MVSQVGAHLHKMLDESFAFRREEVSTILQSTHATLTPKNGFSSGCTLHKMLDESFTSRREEVSQTLQSSHAIPLSHLYNRKMRIACHVIDDFS